MKNQINKYSKTITQDESLPAAQAMLYAIGMSEQGRCGHHGPGDRGSAEGVETTREHTAPRNVEKVQEYSIIGIGGVRDHFSLIGRNSDLCISKGI